MAEITLRPAKLPITIWAGNTDTVRLTWPANALDGTGPWTASATDGTTSVTLPVTVNGDEQTITIPQAVEDLQDTVASWTLADDGQVVIAGRFHVTNQPGPATITATVEIVEQTVSVSVLSDAPVASVNGETGAVVLDAADVEADPAGSAQAVTDDLTSHEADQTAHGDPLGALAAHEATFFTPHMARSAAFGERWFQARAEAGSRQVRVHIWGGSITNGVPGPTDPLTTSWSGRVETALRAAYGDGGSGYRSADFTTRTGTWTAEIGFAAVGFRAIGAATMTWTGLSGTTIKLFYRNANIAGSFRYRVDGGSFTTVTPPTAFGVEPGVTTISGLDDVPHTVEVEWVSGAVVIHGVEASRSTGIVTARCAYGGRAYSHYARNNLARFSIGITNGSPTITSTTPGVFNSSMVSRYLHAASGGLPFDAQVTAVGSATSATISANATATATRTVDLCVNRPSSTAIPLNTVQPGFGEGLKPPDLLVLAMGVNDMAEMGGSNAGTASTNLFRDGLSNLIQGYYRQYTEAVDYTPDLVVVQEHLANFADPLGSGPQVAATARQAAAGMGGAYVDIWGMGRRSWQYWADLGRWADTVHPNDNGAQAMADPVIALLTS